MGRGAVQNMVSISKSRDMMLGLKVRFLAVPIAIYGCESINQSISFFLTTHFSNNMNQGCLQAIGKILNMLIK